MKETLTRGQAGRAIETLAMSPMPKSMSACCHAVLAYFGMDPWDQILSGSGALGREKPVITNIAAGSGYLSLNFLLPMAFGTGYMTVTTIGPASIRMPGIRLSPAIVAASLGQPIGRLTGHRAFDEAHFLRVKSVQEAPDEQGRRATLLHFDDHADPFRGGGWPMDTTIQ